MSLKKTVNKNKIIHVSLWRHFYYEKKNNTSYTKEFKKLRKTKYEQYQSYLNKFVDKVNDWMACDTFVTNTKYKENELDSLYNYMKELLNTNE